MDSKKIAGITLIPAFLVIITVLAVLHIPTVFEPPFVLALLNTLFLGIIPIIIAVLAGRVVVRSGSLAALLMGAGILLFGLASMAAGWLNPLPGGPNMTVTVHNTGACLGSLLILAGAFMSRPAPAMGADRRGRTLLVAVLYGVVLISVVLFSLGAMSGLTPPFFIPGSGPTVLRQFVLEEAAELFALSSLLLFLSYWRERSDYFFWNAVAFALVAIGLQAVFFQPSVGSLIGWAGRSAQYLGCVIALYAVLTVYRVAMSKGLPIDRVIADYFVDAEKSYRQLVESATDAIVTYDEEYRVILWNASAERMFGYTRAEAIGSSFLQLITDDPGSVYMDTHENIPENRDTSDTVTRPVEVHARRKDGTLFSAEVTVSHRWYEGGVMHTCIIRDLTERKRVEKEMAHLASFPEMNPSPVLELDAAGAVMYANPAARGMLEGVSETPGYSLLVPGDWDPIRTALLAGERTAMTREVALGGKIFLETLTMYPEFRVVRIYAQDITVRKHMEESLKKTRDYLDHLLDYANAPIIVWDPAFRITRFNHAFEMLTGRTEGQVIGQPLDVLFPEESRISALEKIQKTLAGERWESVEIPIRTVTGDTRYVLWNSANILGPDGILISTIAQGQDITERRMAEHALKEVNRKLNLLSGITRHDIKNQLIVINGYLGLIEQEITDPVHAGYLSRVVRASERVGRMIQFTKIYEDIGVKAPVWLNVRTLISATAPEVVPERIRLENDIPGDLEMYADSLAGKVFYNLMDNTARHGGEGVTVIRFSGRETGNEYHILCEDDGTGVQADIKEKIFERGFGENTGLGLFLSREVLGITGITIRETGEPGKGARFEIAVPKERHRLG